MSSSYSILHNYNNVPLFSNDYAFTGQALSYKQQGLDANRSKIQGLLDSIPALDVYRDVDKEYVNARLNAVTDITNKYANMDLSDPGLSNSLVENINQVMDTNVKNAIYSTKVFRAEQAEWEQQKEKNPDKYSDLNRGYAMRYSEKWRTGQTPGETYQGGGGFKEYSDWRGKVTKELPGIAEKMGWTYEVVEGGEGVLRYKNTYEKVDRNQVQAALEGMLNEKDREQMKIDAWGTYGNMSEEQIAERFDEYRQGKMDKIQQDFNYFEAGYNTETNPDKKEQYRQLRDRAEKDLADWTNNTAESVFEKYGVEVAYTSIFNDEARENYLNAYSYAPRQIKTDVDQMSLEQQKIRDKQFDQGIAASRLKLSQDRFEFEMVKYQEKTSGSGGGSDLPVIDSISSIGEEEGYDPSKPSHIKAQQKLEFESIEGMKDLLKDEFGSLTNDQILQLGGQLKDIAGKDSVTLKIDGQAVKIDLTNDYNLDKVLKFKNNILDDTPVKKFEQDQRWKMIRDINSKLADSDANFSTMFNYNFALVPSEKDAEGNILTFKVAPSNYKGNSSYGYLAMKKNRTKAEEATLNMYTAFALIADPNTDTATKKSIYDTVVSKMYSRIEASDRNKLPQNWYAAAGDVGKDYSRWRKEQISIVKQQIDGTYKGDPTSETPVTPYSAKEMGFEKQLTEYGKLYSQLKTASPEDAKQIKNRLSQLEAEAAKTVLAPTQNLPSWGDRHLSGQGFDSYIKTTVTNTNMSLETQLADQNYEMGLTSQTFSPSFGKNYKALAVSVGLPETSKVPIKTTRRLDANGNPTGQVDVTYTVGTGKNAITYSSEPYAGENTTKIKPLSGQQVQSLGIQYAESGRPTYRASYGANAPKVELGNGVVSRETENRVRRIMPELPLDNVDAYLDDAKQYGVQKPIADALAGFRGGQYQFKMEPRNGVWAHIVLQGGKEVYVEPTQEQDFSDSEIREMYKNSYLLNQQVFNNYVSELKEQAIRDAKINAARQ